MSYTAVALSGFLAVWLTPSPAICEGLAQRENAAPVLQEFHLPTSAAEGALDEIIKLDDTNPAMFLFVIKRPDRNSSLDHLYSPLFSRELQSAWQRAEKEMVQRSCGGHYTQGDICGLDYSPLNCAQDYSDFGYAFRTVSTSQGTAIIEMKWADRRDVVAAYRMIYRDKWILDGVSCANGSKFNWEK